MSIGLYAIISPAINYVTFSRPRYVLVYQILVPPIPVTSVPTVLSVIVFWIDIDLFCYFTVNKKKSLTAAFTKRHACVN